MCIPKHFYCNILDVLEKNCCRSLDQNVTCLTLPYDHPKPIKTLPPSQAYERCPCVKHGHIFIQTFTQAFIGFYTDCIAKSARDVLRCMQVSHTVHLVHTFTQTPCIQDPFIHSDTVYSGSLLFYAEVFFAVHPWPCLAFTPSVFLPRPLRAAFLLTQLQGVW